MFKVNKEQKRTQDFHKTSKVERFTTIVHTFLVFTILAKLSILEIWGSPGYATNEVTKPTSLGSFHRHYC